MSPVRGIRPIVRARRDDPTDLTAAELAALPATAPGSDGLRALEEALELFAAAAALPSEADRCS